MNLYPLDPLFDRVVVGSFPEGKSAYFQTTLCAYHALSLHGGRGRLGGLFKACSIGMPSRPHFLEWVELRMPATLLPWERYRSSQIRDPVYPSTWKALIGIASVTSVLGHR